MEFAFNYGPFESQLEFSVAWQQRTGEPTTHLKAAYFQAAYFLTGEHRPYNTETGIFERVRPIRPFSFKGGGWGAWQVGLRYSYLDLNSDFDEIRGGNAQQVGVALNWFLLSSVRLSMNYLYVAPLNDGSSSIFQMRAQLDF